MRLIDSNMGVRARRMGDIRKGLGLGVRGRGLGGRLGMIVLIGLLRRLRTISIGIHSGLKII